MAAPAPLLEARYGVRRGDLRGLLAEIARDCAGAVVIVPADAPPPAAGVGHPEPISAAELAREVRLLPERPLGDDDRVRVSLAGQQAKLLLVRTPDGGWTRPVGGYPSTPPSSSPVISGTRRWRPTRRCACGWHANWR